MEHIVGIGEYIIMCGMHDTIKTFALASCVAVTVYEPGKPAAGMAHIALPTPSTSGDGELSPGKYATTAIPVLLNTMCNSLDCPASKLEVKLYGGAESIRNNDVFNIGRKNIAAVLHTLELMQIKPIHTELGGKIARTLEMDVATGSVKVFRQSIVI